MTSPTFSLTELPATLSQAVPSSAEVGAFADTELTAAQRCLAHAREVLDAASAQIAAEIARRSVREFGHSGLAQQAGFSDPARFVQKLTGSSLSTARKLVTVGGLLADAEVLASGWCDPEPSASAAGSESVESASTSSAPTPAQLAGLTELAGGWDAGLGVALSRRWVTVDQVDAIRAGLQSPPDDAATPAWRKAAIELLAETVRIGLTVEELRTAARKRLGLLNADAIARLERSRFEARSLTRRTRADGMTLWQILADPESDARLSAAIGAISSPRRGGPRFIDPAAKATAEQIAGDPRSRQQFDFDSFLAIFITGVNADPKKLFPTSRPEVRVVVSAKELRKALQTPATNRAAADTPTGTRAIGGLAHLDAHPDPISAHTALRMICAGGFIPMLFDESGRALDVGRERRHHTAKQRDALAVRDGGCVIPGCPMPASMCEAHHITPWSDDGPTSVDDGVLLCRFHHMNLHNTRGRITRETISDDTGTRIRYLRWRPGDTEPTELRHRGLSALQPNYSCT